MGSFAMTCPSCGDMPTTAPLSRCTSCGSSLTISRAQVQGLTADLPIPKVVRRAVDRRPFAAPRGSHRG